MRVYIVVPDYGYEGYGKPEGAYKTKKLAEQAVERTKDRYACSREIIELVLEDRRNVGPPERDR